MLYHGDLFDVLPTLAENSLEACVCDPPYDLTNRTPDVNGCESCGRTIGGKDGNPVACPRCGGELTRQRSVQRKGFMGKEWDGTGVAFKPETWRAVYRVLKPGAFLLAFGGTRTQHRMVSAIEDAGFEIRDSFLYWGFGNGFPKSLNVSQDERLCQCGKDRRLPTVPAASHQKAAESCTDVLFHEVHGTGAAADQLSPAAVSSLRRFVDSDGPLSGSEEQDVFACVRESADATASAENDGTDSEYDMRDMWKDVPSSAEQDQGGDTADLFTKLQRETACAGVAPVLRERKGTQANAEIRRVEPSMEGRGHVLQAEGKLQGHPVSASAGMGAPDGAEGRLHHGASPGDGQTSGPAFDAHGSRASRRPRSDEQRPDKPRVVANEREPQAPRRWPTCERCGKSMVPSGLGTALKPSYEPIVVARKPLQGTVAANVQQWGTGALHIDACRIAVDPDEPNIRTTPSQYANRSVFGVGGHTGTLQQGRWPANVLLGCCGQTPHDPACAAGLLDAQSGIQTSGTAVNRNRPPGIPNQIYGKGWDHSGRDEGYGDVGGASRFFATFTPDCLLCEGPCRTIPVSTAEQPSATIRQITGASALSRVGDSRVVQLVQAAPSADGLCERCAMFIALVLVEPGTLRSPVFTAFRDSISGSTSSILIHNLAPIAELLESIGTIPTMDNLLSLFGCVRAATVDTIRRGRSEVPENTGSVPTRFRYEAKPSAEERSYGLRGDARLVEARYGSIQDARPHTSDGYQYHRRGSRNSHPTVKPVALMRWLVKLVTPPGGTVLDCFMGSGTTGMACRYEHRQFIGIERDAEYFAIAKSRIEAVAPLFGDAEP